MARQLITMVRITRAVFTPDPTPTTLSATDGNYVLNDGATILQLTNGSGSSRTVSVRVPEGVDIDLAVTSRTYALSNGQTGKVGIFPREVYGSQLLVDVSGTGVTAVALSVR